MRHLLGRMNANQILLNMNPQLLQSLLPLLLNLLSPRHLLLPRLVQTLHELLARLQLLLQLRLRDRLDRPILRLVRDLLLGRGDCRVEDGFRA